jgi:hypothetical protein
MNIKTKHYTNMEEAIILLSESLLYSEKMIINIIESGLLLEKMNTVRTNELLEEMKHQNYGLDEI